MEIFERAKGKINLTLDITGESGGFHLLDMLVATIDLFDDVKITYRADDKIECVQDGEIADEKNSAYRAAKLMKDTFGTRGFTVETQSGFLWRAAWAARARTASRWCAALKNAGHKSRFYHAGVFVESRFGRAVDVLRRN